MIRTLLPILSVIILSIVHTVNAQEMNKIGEWGTILPLLYGPSIAQSSDHIYYSSDQSLMVINKSDGEYKQLTKVDGLSGADLTVVQFNAVSESLVIAYQNANIDVIRDGRIFNFNQIRNNLSIIGDKSIYRISNGSDNSAYLSTGFGLVQLNLDVPEFGFTTFTNMRVFDFLESGDNYYMGTQDGLYYLPNVGISNPSDFNSWTYLGALAGLPEGFPVTDVEEKDGKIYVASNDRIYVSGNMTDFELFFSLPGYSIQFISAKTQKLSVGFLCNSGCDAKVILLDSEGNRTDLPDFCAGLPRDAIQDESGRIWLADGYGDYRRIESDLQTCTRLTYNAIQSNTVTDITSKGDELAVATGGMSLNTSNLFRESGFMLREDNVWKSYNKNTVDTFDSLDVRDVLRVSYHPKSDTLFVGIYYSGLVKWNSKDDFTIYDETNSTLKRGIGDPNRIRVSGLAWDSKTNLWIAQYDAARPISVYKTDGTFQSFSPPGGSTDLLDVVVDNFDNKWFRVFKNGMLVFNEGPDINDPSGYKYREITTSNSNLPNTSVNCMHVDLDGSLWAGTDAGIMVFECGADPFDAERCRGTDRRLEQDGFGAILLETENIRVITTDGANRKWIGTANGIFVQSPDGNDPVYNFNVTNSPLLDNSITEIYINPDDGLVYIASDKGIQTFKGDALNATPGFQSEVYAYPNPVRPDYTGPIAIKGLARDANIKITDIEGRLVFESRALGAQAIWDGNDFNGRRVASGVYLVFATYTTNREFPQTHVTKLVVIN
jgi:hypothetical protein